jgi:hypothetical protein
MHRIDSRAWLLVFTCCLSLLGGCGSDRPKTVKVTGRVTFRGESMPGPGVLYFVPMDVAEGLPHRPGTARFEQDGRFAVGSFEMDDGLVPGDYRVHVQCWEVAPQEVVPEEEAPAPISFIPTRYGDTATSGLSVSVPADRREVEVRFELTD